MNYGKNKKFMVKYYYDAYGRIIKTNDTSGINLSSINPFRYRSYYQDNETGWYYLNSRYYNPLTNRFITMNQIEYLGESGSLLSLNLYGYCENNPVNFIDKMGLSITAGVLGGSLLNSLISSLLAIGTSNSWNVVGWALLIVIVAIIAVCSIITIVRYAKDKAYSNAISLMASAAASPIPPDPNNKGSKGTKTSSKTVYDKKGIRIDVENPGGRPGNIHVHKGNAKYYYDFANQTFVDSAGREAPKAITNLLKDKSIIKAIGKGLKILGY